jgi:sialate O-acetylesterase
MYLTDGTTTIDLSGSWKINQDQLQVPSNPENPLQSPLLPNQFPTLLYNGMINPIINYAIKGVIWYQGESNADRLNQALKYENQLKNMILDWRNHWGIGDFSFYQVQLANFRQETQKPQSDIWPYLREAQANVAKIPHAGMACIIDIGNANDIHPTDKIDVGNRLALLALKNDYIKDVIANGPQVNKVTIEMNKAIVFFKEAGTGLVVKNKYGYINGFSVAGADQIFHYARAALRNKNTVEITSDGPENIEAVRFLWADNPGEINLYNSEGLPAEPFRTDKW